MTESIVRRVTLAMVVLLLSAGTALAQARSTAWSEPVDITGGANDGQDLFGVLLCDRAQRVHLLWGKSGLNGSAIYYRSSSDGFWSEPVDVLALPDAVAIRLSAVITRDDTLHVFWENLWIGGDTYYSRVLLSRASDVRYWTEPQILEHPGGSIAETPDGILHRLYGASDNGGLHVGLYHTWSGDGGDNWHEPVLVWDKAVFVPSGLSAAVAIDDRGRIHVGITIRSVEYGVYSELGYLRSTDAGRSWDPYLAVQQSTADNSNFSTVSPYAFGDDEVHLTWHAPARMHQWSADGGDTWSTPEEIMPLGAAFGGANQLVKDSAGYLHVVTAVGGAVYSARWDGVTWSAPERIEDRSMDPHAQSMVVCGGNQLYVVYDDRHEDNATVWLSQRELDSPAVSGTAVIEASGVRPAAAIVETATLVAAQPGLTANIAQSDLAEGMQQLASPGLTTAQPLILSSLAVVAVVGGAAVLASKRRR